MDASSVFLAAKPAKLPYWDFVRDLNGDVTPELILPQVGRYLIYSTADTRLPSGVLLSSLQIGVRRQGLNRFAGGGSVVHDHRTPHFLFRDVNQDSSDRLGGPPDKVIHPGFGALADGTETIREGEPPDQLFKYISEVRDLNGDGQTNVTVITTSDGTGLDVFTEI